MSLQSKLVFDIWCHRSTNYYQYPATPMSHHAANESRFCLFWPPFDQKQQRDTALTAAAYQNCCNTITPSPICVLQLLDLVMREAVQFLLLASMFILLFMLFSLPLWHCCSLVLLLLAAVDFVRNGAAAAAAAAAPVAVDVVSGCDHSCFLHCCIVAVTCYQWL